MSTPVTFAAHLDFGTATYGATVERDTSIDTAPAAAKVTAALTGGQPFFAVVLTAYTVKMEPVPASKIPAGYKGPPLTEEVRTATGTSDGTIPLHVAKGQSLTVAVTMTVPARAVTPGPSNATLTIHSATWGTETIEISADYLSVDESTPIGAKWLEVGIAAAVGPVLANTFTMSDGGSFQEFANGTIFFSPDFGPALLSDAICNKLNSASVSATDGPSGQIIRDILGYPTGDSFSTQEPSGQAAYFAQGMVVVRPNDRVFVLYGLIYGHYRQLGSIAQGDANPPVVGLPIADQAHASGYSVGHFDGGDIYQSNSQSHSPVCEIHGAIRDRWIETGGPTGPLGLPLSDELPVMNGPAQVGRYNTFAGDGSPTGGARIYWRADLGAWDVSREILTAWLAAQGPVGPLGFPTSGASSTAVGTGFNAFEHGVVVLRAGSSAALPVQGLQLNVYEFSDDAHDSFNVQIKISDSRGQSNVGRMPASDNYHNGSTDFDPPSVLLSVDPSRPVTSDYTMDVWMLCIHENTFGTDDEDGTITAHYDIDNAWGIADSSALSNGAFHAVMKPIPEPQTVSTDPSVYRTTFFWPFKNFDTDPLPWSTYARTYSDVGAGDADLNLGTLAPWNWHLFERAFYQFVYQMLGEHGDCFGMSLESIFARDHATPFVEPIYDSPYNSYAAAHPPVDPNWANNSHLPQPTYPDRSNPNDSPVMEEINIRHGYQLGADFIEWFLGEKLIGNLHDPQHAYSQSEAQFQRGDWPILTISKDDALSANAHVVVPFRWEPNGTDDRNQSAMIMYVANPNCPGASDGSAGNRVFVYSDNSFRYIHSDSSVWTGNDESGGRLLSIPFSVLNSRPVTLGDAIFDLIAGGVVLLMAGDGQATQVTDANGRTLYAAVPLANQAARQRAAERIDENVVAVGNPSGSAQTVRRLNTNPSTSIPNMMVVPLHDAGQSPASARRTTVPIVGLEPRPTAIPFDLYYIKRPAPRVAWPRPIRFVEREAIGHAGRVSTGARVSAIVRVSAFAPPRVARPVRTPAFLTARYLGHAASRFILDENAITIHAGGMRTGTYQLAVYSPRMSVTIQSPTGVESRDVIVMSDLGAPAQAMTFAPDPRASSRQFTVAVTGWRGARAPVPRSYVLANLAIQPGHSIVASLNDGGCELWLTNPNDVATFDLTVFAGAESTSAISRTNVALDARAVTRIRPATWEIGAIASAKVSLAVFDAQGTMVREAML